MHVRRPMRIADVRDAVAEPHAMDKCADWYRLPVSFRKPLHVADAKAGARTIMVGRCEVRLMTAKLRPLAVGNGGPGFPAEPRIPCVTRLLGYTGSKAGRKSWAPGARPMSPTDTERQRQRRTAISVSRTMAEGGPSRKSRSRPMSVRITHHESTCQPSRHADAKRPVRRPLPMGEARRSAPPAPHRP